jgi:membrane protein
MVSLVLSAAVTAFGKWFGGGAEALAHALELILSFGLMAVLFELIYKFIPRVHIAWHDVWIGAAVTALLLSFGKFLIGLYLGKSAVASSFGAAGSLVVLMVWVYYAAQIFLLGAEFTWVYAHEYGSRKGEPRPGAEERKPPADEPEIQPALPANGPVWSPPAKPRRSPLPAFAAFAAGALVGFFTLERKVTRD